MRLTPVAGLQPPEHGEADDLDGHDADQDVTETATRLLGHTGAGRFEGGTYSRVLQRGQPVDIKGMRSTFSAAPCTPCTLRTQDTHVTDSTRRNPVLHCVRLHRLRNP